MRTAAHANSIAAYHSSGPLISRRARMVLEWVRKNGQATDRQIVEGLGFRDMNACRPRVTELVQMGALVEVGSARCAITGKTVRIVDVPSPMQGRLFS